MRRLESSANDGTDRSMREGVNLVSVKSLRWLSVDESDGLTGVNASDRGRASTVDRGHGPSIG